MLRTTLLMAGTVVLAWSAQAAAAADPQAGGPGSDPPVVSASLGAVAVASGQEPTAPSSPAAPSQEDQAAAADTQTGHDFTWKWDNTLTYGLGFRLRDQDSRIIGLRSGGKAFSVNGDDGNLNYDKGMFTNAVKWTTEFQFSYKDFGGFFRAFAFYDFENENSDRVRTPLTDDAMRRVGSRAEIRDAFGYYRFKMGRMPGEIRAGWQVINWGESTFIQGGINAINPIDVSVLRVPGAELRDALLPVGAVKFSVKPTTNTSFEAFYQFTWEDLKVDPVGSYFSTTDLAGAGAQKVMLGFGSAPDYVLVGDTWVDYRGPVPGNPVGVAVPKVDADEPSEQGQYGAALRYLAEGLGGTEFGLYFINYHSRLPLIMANTGTRNALLVNGNYAGSASYFLTYPEDIQLLGGSFNTQLGRTGIALQGEVSHRWRVPLQMDDVELLYAALTPLRLLPPIPQLAPLIGLGNLLASQNQIGRYGFSEQIRGYRRFETTQAQMTATKAISQIFWADQMVLVGEVGWGRVHDLPSPSVLRLEGPGTYTSANPIFTAAGVQPGTEPTRAFPTSDAWGYVFAGRLEYGNVIGAVNMTPRMSFAHDVGGISPGPGGAFLEGRKAFTFGLGFQYQYNWEFDVSYTDYFGADRYNLINDRDFIAANIKYSF